MTLIENIFYFGGWGMSIYTIYLIFTFFNKYIKNEK